jgi:hypothetical protein
MLVLNKSVEATGFPEWVGYLVLIFIHTDLTPPHEFCENSDLAEHYHILGP